MACAGPVSEVAVTIPSVITLSTDFGTRDGFTGQMKGVILRIHPEATLVDVTHDLEPFDVVGAALVLKGVSGYYPKGCTHVAVVDPQVGSERRGIAVRCSGQTYVGPDNGLFTFVLGPPGSWEAREIANPALVLTDPHPTFHGRDIFAPVAAWLAKGCDFAEVGPRVSDPVVLNVPQPQETADGIGGQIIYVDRFGNLSSNIPAERLLHRIIGRVRIGDVTIDGISHFFAEAEEGRAIALVNSFGFLEIAVNRGNASQSLGVSRGAPVRVVWDK
jgi:S-adenosyl-L-methionine hydrolase (adenosine-forming)